MLETFLQPAATALSSQYCVSVLRQLSCKHLLMSLLRVKPMMSPRHQASSALWHLRFRIAAYRLHKILQRLNVSELLFSTISTLSILTPVLSGIMQV